MAPSSSAMLSLANSNALRVSTMKPTATSAEHPTSEDASLIVSDTLETSSCENSSPDLTPRLGSMGLSRTKSLFSMSSTTSSASSAASVGSTEEQAEEFGRTLHSFARGGDSSPNFDDAGIRRVMEPHLRRARLSRERQRTPIGVQVDASIASSVGVPYTSLRHERPFLFDEHSYPLHEILAQTLEVGNLSTSHEIAREDILKPLLDSERRRAFHAAYDGFVTSFCIPLLHSLAIAKNILHTSSSDQIVYRYQAFPTIRVRQPGQKAVLPDCDSARGHSVACLRFHIPLTPTFGTNALYTESHPGREDWHALHAKSVGLGYLYDGARCLSFAMENTTAVTSVSLDFCVMIYREFYGKMTDDGGLCPQELIDDRFSKTDPSFYDEAVIDLGRSPLRGLEVVVKKQRNLMPPSKLVGAPFA